MEIFKRTVTSPKGDITIYKIINGTGASVEISTLGAGIVSICVPDKNGELEDVVLGYANPVDYFYDGPCAGKIPGRYANRIAKGHFSLNGKDYNLAINNGPNALHGGPEGFHDSNELTLKIEATSDADTIINLTNHAYFNLSGEGSGNIFNHTLRLAAHKYLPTDDTLIPTGEIADVAGTPMDFTEDKAIGKDIKCDFPALNYGKGYDNCWVIDNWDGEIKEIAILTDSVSGRTLKVSTDQPAVQVYTGNWLDGCPKSKSGKEYHDYDGVAIECQGMPDAPNKPQFPTQKLNAGDIYSRTIKFSFLK